MALAACAALLPLPAVAAGPYVDDPCVLRELPTPYQGYDDHDLTVLDWTYRLNDGYAPPDLVPASRAGFAGTSGSKLVRDDLIADLAALRSAAAAAGHALRIQSAFRSAATQSATFDFWVAQVGYEAALRRSARPGHSEHQLGTTIDFTSGGAAPWQVADWGATGAGSWMAANAWRHGWVMSYPHGATDRTCYDYEPWHYRWVGRHAAAAQVLSTLPLRDFLVERLNAAFVDIRFTPFEADITWLAASGITSGCSASRFCPVPAVTRAEMASFLVRAFHLGAEGAPDAFTDDDGTLHEPAINRLAASGVTTGCAPGRFCHTGPVTRAEMASFLARALGLHGTAAPDAFADDNGSLHEPAINALAAAGVTSGCGTSRFCPSQPVAREQMAAFLRRALAG